MSHPEDAQTSTEATGKPSDLEAALGRVVMADAQLDERLFRWLATLLPELQVDLVSLLFRNERSESKVKRLRQLLAGRGADARALKVGGLTLDAELKRMASLRQERNRLVHAFYDKTLTPAGGARLFASRDGRVEDVLVEDVEHVATQLVELGRHLEVMRQEYEHQTNRSHPADAIGLLEDARELLIVGRLSRSEEFQDLVRAFTGGVVRLALRGRGKFRLLGANGALRT